MAEKQKGPELALTGINKKNFKPPTYLLSFNIACIIQIIELKWNCKINLNISFHNSQIYDTVRICIALWKTTVLHFTIEGQNTSYPWLTINLVFLRNIGMEDIKCSNKVTKINDSLPLNIKQIKDLHVKVLQSQNKHNWLKASINCITKTRKKILCHNVSININHNFFSSLPPLNSSND